MARRCKGCPIGLPWIPFVIHGEAWMTAFVPPEDCRIRVKRKWIMCDGLTCFHCRRILLNARQTDEEIAHTLFHEGSHASRGEEGGERVILGIEAGIWA